MRFGRLSSLRRVGQVPPPGGRREPSSVDDGADLDVWLEQGAC